MDGSERGRKALRLIGVPLGLLAFLSLPTPGAAQDAPPVEELYDARLGCGGCHGQSGEGAMGPALRETEIPLRDFVRLVRAPRELMPRFSPFIVSDAELADIYAWLDGVEGFETPLPLTLAVEGFGAAGAAEEAKGAFTLRAADGGSAALATRERPVRLRLTLTAQEGDRPISGHTAAYRFGGGGEWRETMTDGEGQAHVGPDDDLLLADFAGGAERSAEVRIPALPPGRYAVVIEALDRSEPSSATVIAIGSAVIDVAGSR